MNVVPSQSKKTTDTVVLRPSALPAKLIWGCSDSTYTFAGVPLLLVLQASLLMVLLHNINTKAVQHCQFAQTRAVVCLLQLLLSFTNIQAVGTCKLPLQSCAGFEQLQPVLEFTGTLFYMVFILFGILIEGSVVSICHVIMLGMYPLCHGPLFTSNHWTSSMHGSLL